MVPQRLLPVEAALPMLLLMAQEGNHRHLRPRQIRPLSQGAGPHAPQVARMRVEMPILTGVDRVVARAPIRAPILAPILAKADGTRTHKSRRQDTGPGKGRGCNTVERRRRELRGPLARIARVQAGVRRKVSKLRAANGTHWDR